MSAVRYRGKNDEVFLRSLMMKMEKVFIVLGLLAAITIPANAAYYWADNFDTETAGTSPDNWTTNGTTVEITNTAYRSSPNAMKLYDDSASGRPEAFRSFTALENGRLTWDFHVPTTHMYLYLRAAGSSGYGTVLASFDFDWNHWHYDGGEVSGAPYVSGWAKLTLTWSDATATSAGTYDVSVYDYANGTTASVTGINMCAAGTPGTVFIRAGYDSGTGATTYIDNVTIVPEPATITLLLLSLPFALRRRR